MHTYIYIYIYLCAGPAGCRGFSAVSRTPPPISKSPLNREFTKGGLVKGGLAIYVLLLYHYC